MKCFDLQWKPVGNGVQSSRVWEIGRTAPALDLRTLPHPGGEGCILQTLLLSPVCGVVPVLGCSVAVGALLQ